MNRYTAAALEIQTRIELLKDRATRWGNHPTLNTRVPGVLAEISKLEPQVKKLHATGKWQDELNATR